MTGCEVPEEQGVFPTHLQISKIQSVGILMIKNKLKPLKINKVI